MTTLSQAFYRAQSAWLEIPDPFYTQDDINEELRSINAIIHEFIEDVLYDVEETSDIRIIINQSRRFIEALKNHEVVLAHIEDHLMYEE